MVQIRLKSLIIFFFLIAACSNHSYGLNGVTFYKFDSDNKEKSKSLKGGIVTQRFKNEAINYCRKIKKPNVVLVRNNEILEEYKCNKNN